jgi:hypothetical protein
MFLRTVKQLTRSLHRATLYGAWYHHRNARTLRPLIKGQAILILGSGPSAAELNMIPKDIKVFTCKAGLKLLRDKRLTRTVGLYIYDRGIGTKALSFTNEQADQSGKVRVVDRNAFTEQLLQEFSIDTLITKNPQYISNNKVLRGVYQSLIYDRAENNFYLRKLLGWRSIRNVSQLGDTTFTSSGMRLLQYALFFEARIIYLVGLDLMQPGFFWGGAGGNKHWRVDKYFIRQMANQHKNIYSIAQHSPISKYLPVKQLGGQSDSFSPGLTSSIRRAKHHIRP